MSKIIARTAAAALVLSAAAVPAFAAAPEPAKSVSPSVYSGVWHEIARFPNTRQRDCLQGRFEFAGRQGGGFDVSLVCPKAGGKETRQTARGSITDTATNAKFRANFVLGLGATYHVIDRAADNSWVLLGTSGGNYLWLLSRSKTLPARAAAVAAAKAAGYDTSKFIFPKAA